MTEEGSPMPPFIDRKGDVENLAGTEEGKVAGKGVLKIWGERRRERWRERVCSNVPAGFHMCGA